MSRYGICLVVLLFGCVVWGQEDTTKKDDHYPEAWAQVDFKPIIDNDRLFKKYKECVLQDKPRGCPRDVLEVKKVIPEVLDSMCSKCLPIHIEKFKAAAEYTCHHRRADFDEIRKLRDPEGKLQEKFEAKFGKINC